jgi:hypothetical protein
MFLASSSALPCKVTAWMKLNHDDVKSVMVAVIMAGHFVG